MEIASNTAAQIHKLRKIHVPNERDLELKKHLYRLFEVDSEGNLTAVPCRYTGGQETRGVTIIEKPGGERKIVVRRIVVVLS